MEKESKMMKLLGGVIAAAGALAYALCGYINEAKRQAEL
jgi:hypothetical protein